MVPPKQDTIGEPIGCSSGSCYRPRQRGFARFSRLAAIAFVSLAGILSVGCDKSKKTESISTNFDPETNPTMVTRPVTTLISDSGITRYRITAPVWYVYDEATEPHWNFPEGMNMEKFDDLFRQQATVRCDSATYLTRKQLWRLDGYVHIENVAGEQFLTQQLFWDQRSHKIYSDSFIHILRADRVIEGYGFESDEQMAHYKVRQVQGIFPVSQFQNGEQEDRGQPRRVTVDNITAENADTTDVVKKEDILRPDSLGTDSPVDTRRPTRPRHKQVLKPTGASGLKRSTTL